MTVDIVNLSLTVGVNDQESISDEQSIISRTKYDQFLMPAVKAKALGYLLSFTE